MAHVVTWKSPQWGADSGKVGQWVRRLPGEVPPNHLFDPILPLSVTNTTQVINKFCFYFPRENKWIVSIPAPLSKKNPILVTGQTIDPKREVQQDFFHFYDSPTSCVPVTWAEATKLVSPLRSHQASWHSSTGARISNLRNVFPMVKVSLKI